MKFKIDFENSKLISSISYNEHRIEVNKIEPENTEIKAQILFFAVNIFFLTDFVYGGLKYYYLFS